MKFFVIIPLLFFESFAIAQNDAADAMKRLHIALVKKEMGTIRNLLADRLSYGHSNGWIENKEEMLANLESGTMIYRSFAEDSISIAESGRTVVIRFVADIEASLRGTGMKLRLKVLEVWVKKKRNWMLLARQAVRG